MAIRTSTAFGFIAVLLTTIFGVSSTYAQDTESLLDSVLASLEFRAIGPAVAGGRIADIAIHPAQPRTWYLAVGSGGVWKSSNAGTTWQPLFDDQISYSIGEITLDPTNPDVVWVGTGENVSGRHVGWGDGLYRSRDGGQSWESMGLKESEHISRILIHPEDSNTLLVAAEGPLWSSGGERGVYRSIDGGQNWTQVLEIDDDTGATDLEFHPTNPSIVYAATYERRRAVWSFLAGGQGSGIYKSEDGGETWREVTKGLPSADDGVEVGKIGLAVTPADPDRVYATIEASDDQQGFYVSLDRGESWSRRNEYISGGTGPHYYQEIEASPVDADRVYQMDVFLHTTRDGGNSFTELGTGREKHSDNHALWIDPSAPNHLLVGTDAGLYETFDDGITWRHSPNLPISQFYKLAVSNHAPYYQVLVGAQDLGTLLGPARTLHQEGVRNEDWTVTYGADGYGVAFDTGDPDLLYQMSQRGNLVRHHVPSGENVYIRPRPTPGEGPERWNWDSPLTLSAHNPSRIYFASQRVWRSDDRGDSWTAISGDLTTGANRFELPVNDRVRSADALWDLGAMSGYASLTALAESPLDEGRLWTGSDDGLVYTSADGGSNWSDVTPPKLPERAFINMIIASEHSPDAAFIVADNHKTGDYRPMVYATDNGGRSWRDISGDLPDTIIAWSIAQDHVEPDLLFLAAENGLYVSLNGGEQWRRMEAGVPTISFRDLKLQRRDGDLVGGSFGRGVYVLDDYSPLRELAAQYRESKNLNDGARLFGVRDAWWYIPSTPGQAPGLPTRGSTAWRAANPEHGALFTVYLDEIGKTPKEQRRAREQEQAKEGVNISFPGWDALADEARVADTRYLLEIRDSSGQALRRLPLKAEAGAQRITWDMRTAAPNAISFEQPAFKPPWVSDPQGPLVAPGRYEARLLELGVDKVRTLGDAQSFELLALDNLPAGNDPVATARFQAQAADLQRRLAAADGTINAFSERVAYLRAALDAAPQADAAHYRQVDALNAALVDLKTLLRGNGARRSRSEFTVPGVAGWVNDAAFALSTRMAPTATQRNSAVIAADGLQQVEEQLDRLQSETLAELEGALHAAGAPWHPGQPIR